MGIKMVRAKMSTKTIRKMGRSGERERDKAGSIQRPTG
jgi:hypothetical protein